MILIKKTKINSYCFDKYFFQKKIAVAKYQKNKINSTPYLKKPAVVS